MYKPLVSILVPVYNVEKYIERCACSLFQQTYENLEFIFVDDCSQDNSIKILEQCIKKYPIREKHTHIIRHKNNSGAGECRMTGIKCCSGEFLSHVDSDDWLELNAIELLIKKQQESEADIVSGRHLIHCKGVITVRDSGQGMSKDELLTNLCTHQCTSVIWGRIIRKSLYINHSIMVDFRGRYSEDFQVFPQLVYYASGIATIDDIVYNYNRENSNAMTSSLHVNTKIQLEYLLGHEVISQFFADKNLICQSLCDQTALKYYYLFMMYQVRNNNKKGYETIKGALTDNKRLLQGGIKLIYKDYHFLKCFIVAKQVIYQVKKLIKHK